MCNKQNQAELVISLFGGVRKLARAIGRDPAAISRWKKRGVVPTSMQWIILELAWERGLDLTERDLIFGRESSD